MESALPMNYSVRRIGQPAHFVSRLTWCTAGVPFSVPQQPYRSQVVIDLQHFFGHQFQLLEADRNKRPTHIFYACIRLKTAKQVTVRLISFEVERINIVAFGLQLLGHGASDQVEHFMLYVSDKFIIPAFSPVPASRKLNFVAYSTSNHIKQSGGT